MEEKTINCLYCDRDQNSVPLIQIKYQNEDWWICPPHLPLLIHQPQRLVGKLPGVEKLIEISEGGSHHH